MTTVKSLKVFKYQVTRLAKEKDASLFHCYIHGNIFRIATAKKVMDFDFTDFKSEEKIVHFMLIAISVLKKHLNQQILLFDEPGKEKLVGKMVNSVQPNSGQNTPIKFFLMRGFFVATCGYSS